MLAKVAMIVNKKKKNVEAKKKILHMVHKTAHSFQLQWHIKIGRRERFLVAIARVSRSPPTQASLWLARGVRSSSSNPALHGTTHRDSSWYALASVLTWTHASFARKDICARPCALPACAHRVRACTRANRVAYVYSSSSTTVLPTPPSDSASSTRAISTDNEHRTR